MSRNNKWYCNICKKQKPNSTEANTDPCVCFDYREQFAKEGKQMHPTTLEAYIKKRKEYIEEKKNKRKTNKNNTSMEEK